MKDFSKETHTCFLCIHFKRPITGFPICTKKLMGVTKDMFVTYKTENGTCFELK